MFSYGESRPGWAPGVSAETWRSAGVPGVLWVAEPRKKRALARAGEPLEVAPLRALARDANYAAKVARVRRCQALLRRQVSARAWQAYLRLEEAELERWSHALERVARWASSSRRRA